MANPTETSDFEKLTLAFSQIASSMSSVDHILETFGLAKLPAAQRYGILFGCIVFFCTVSAVLLLLVKGGSFERMAEQASSGGNTLPASTEARAERPLLLERLLLARERLMQSYQEKSTDKTTTATTLERTLLNKKPNTPDVSALVNENSSVKKKKGMKQLTDFEQNFIAGYRECQDKPGGGPLGGLPEARFEAYARAYAGCGPWTTTNYRRSYARMYERMTCSTHATEKKYTEHYSKRPQDIIGRTVRLELLDKSRHLKTLYDITNGQSYMEDKSYNPNEVWAFLDCGPFESSQEMASSDIFERTQDNMASFAICEMMTDRLIGVIILTGDDPRNLNIEMQVPICKPTSMGTAEEMEACFLLLDRLFALGYRRVQLCVDAQDVKSKKLPGRLGFTQEGLIPKHRVIKDSNSDSLIYGMLNSDWDKGARAVLYKKLHGQNWTKHDQYINSKAAEVEEQQRVLKARKQEEEMASKNG